MSGADWSRVVAVVLVLATTGCLSDQAFDPDPTFNAGTLTATLGFVSHNSAFVKTQVNSSGAIDVTGTGSDGRVLFLHLTPDAQVGAVTVNASTNTYASYRQSADLLWVTDPLSDVAGVINITARDKKHIAGTFNLEMIPLNSVDHRYPLRVTNGAFDVQY